MLTSDLPMTAVGLMTLLPLYSIGGMGAVDVKLMAGVWAWIGPWLTVWAFVSSAMAGAAMAAGMIVYSGELYRQFLGMMYTIGTEVFTIRNPASAVQK